MTEEARHAVGELAALAGVSRRTVRYYVQEGLLPAPLGVGRGKHYGPEHLARLLHVKTLQENGCSLDEVRRRLAGPATPPDATPDAAAERPIPREMWRRIVLAPGVELHVAADVRLPAPGRLRELVLWCRRYIGGTIRTDEGTDA